jgi:hypothetical protein
MDEPTARIAYAALIDAVIVYPTAVPTKLTYWKIPQDQTCHRPASEYDICIIFHVKIWSFFLI